MNKLFNGDLKRIIIRGNKPRAHWIYKFNPSDGIQGYYCENCDKPRGQVYDDYCAYCGAEMIKGVTND